VESFADVLDHFGLDAFENGKGTQNFMADLKLRETVRYHTEKSMSAADVWEHCGS
jgi:hypothetical protein